MKLHNNIEEYKKKAIDTAKDNIKAIKEGKPFKRCYDDIAETFRSKPTGNRVLGFVCSYCPYKLPCWGAINCSCYHNSNLKVKILNGFGTLLLQILNRKPIV